MNNFRIGAAAAAFILGITARLIFTYLIPPPLPFPIDIVDAFIVLTGAMVAVFSAYEFILVRYRDTAELLPMFSAVIWTVIVSSYLILRYLPAYQTSLSILSTGVFIGMGWWIQAINTAANSRRSHTLNIIMASRTSTEYQQQTRASSKLYLTQVIPPELAEWRTCPQKDEYRYTDVPTDIIDAMNGTVYVLNYFEFLAQGIKYRDLDACLLRECFSGILAGLERRGFHLIIEAQKSDQRNYEGLIALNKEWNGESTVERYRTNPDNSALGTRYPAGEELQNILFAKKPQTTDQPADASGPSLATADGVPVGSAPP
ncbi:DUF4760 domain-containing protein [Pseudomonas arsenicoxydans]|uniref:DUF4760 domain-containing protein n=1 Tax=Pseudomonas arsenicoxydans TaxID=702115 RepID=A0A502HR88_9PSED|nr:DUF4760 domain-containing protein [Pseudomonas arsenicoxydans]TPG76293.1 DUF4760 domain-containing protein [Pseudomonas arsenicoxydans]